MDLCRFPAVYAPLMILVLALIGLHLDPTLIQLPIAHVTAQKTSIQKDIFSKTSGLTSSKFRDNIIQVRQKLQQSFQQQRVSSKTTSNEQQVIEQQQPIKVAQISEQQQIVNDITSTHDHEDVQQSTYSSANVESVYGSVQGTPGVDFPNYSSIPSTEFTCDGLPFEPGMYADESTGCQVYHLCYQGRRESFLCGIGTVFNQAILNCDFWHAVDCSQSSLSYGVNAEFGKSAPEPGAGIVQSISQKTVKQSQQSLVPIRSVHQQSIKSVQQSPIKVPDVQNSVFNERKFESVQRFSSGKTNPSLRQMTSRVSSEMIGTKNLPQLQVQRNFVAKSIISPSRKVAQLNRATFGAQQVISAESSPVKSLSMSSDAKSGKINSSQANLISTENQDQSVAKKSSISAFKSSSKSSFSSVRSGPPKTMQNRASVKSEEQVWKPYFRSKGKTASGKTAAQASVPPAPVNQITNATARDSAPSNGETSTSVRPDLPPSTLAQPDQEPTFSSIENPPSTSSNEVPKVPNSNPPPPTEPSVVSSASVNIEPDVSLALSTTTSSPESEGNKESVPTSDSSADSPMSNGNSTPATTTTQSPQEDPGSLSITTTAAPTSETADVTTTTTASAALESETSAKPDDSANSTEGEQRKKKRGTLVIGVEYAVGGNGRQSSNSSSVVYADKRRSNV